jgi:uncharacterized membrane protein YphA (DoxX/SURF4 family)
LACGVESSSCEIAGSEDEYLKSGTERCRKVGFQHGCTSAYLLLSQVSDGASGRFALQRLYSTFPGGRPGIGLLLLRVAVGLAAAAAGVFYFSGPSGSSSGKSLLGVALIIGGVLQAAGFLTPIAGLVIAICFLGIAFSWIPAPAWFLHDVKLMAFGMIISAVALALLGPGAFSLDGRLFGRREIVIPPSSHTPKS